MMRALNSAVARPSYLPERTAKPGATKGSDSGASVGGPSGLTTSTMGMPYALAKPKSRSSCAGTAMMAPVP